MLIDLDYFSLGKSEGNELSKVRIGMIDSYLCEFVRRKRNKKDQYFGTNFVRHKSILKKVNYFLIIKVATIFIVDPNNE